MTYQGERARPMASESGRSFEVSKVRLGADGRVVDVMWAEVDASTDRQVGAGVVVPVADVIDAIHDGARVTAMFPASAHQSPRLRPEREFVVVEHGDGRESIAFDETPSQGRELSDMAGVDD